MKLKATKDFSWAHRGVEIEQFKEGQVFDTDDKDLITVAKREGWAKPAGKGDDVGDDDKKVDAADENKANAAAPENK